MMGDMRNHVRRHMRNTKHYYICPAEPCSYSCERPGPMIAHLECHSNQMSRDGSHQSSFGKFGSDFV